MTSNRGSNRILASLGSADGRGIVRVEDRYDTDIEDLWSAVTDPARLVRWFGQVDGDLHAGGAFHLSVEWAGTGRVEACEPPHRLRVTIRESDESYRKGNGVPPFNAHIEATLTSDGNQTILAAEIRGMPLDKIAFYGAGWQIHAENLAIHIAGHERGDTEARWDVLVPAYQALAAATAEPMESTE
jgi:uncharacterized protein YndB with AHSA1/START domain